MAWINKNPKKNRSKNPKKMHEKMHKNMKINAKGRVKWTYWLGERKTLQKDRRKTTKNWGWAFAKSERERKVWKTFEKWVWTSQTRFLTASIDRNSKKQNGFEKQPSFVQKLLQALKNINKMHEYEMQSFSKAQVLNPVFPKLRFSNILHKFSSIKSVFA